MIIEYFRQVRAVILQFAHITDDFDISEKVYNDEKGFISGRLRFFNESILEFGEVTILVKLYFPVFNANETMKKITIE